MDDRQQIESLYNKMYEAMVNKNAEAIARCLADDFTLTHMTGLRQSKRDYINAILDGTLNYYSARHEMIDVSVNGDQALLTGRSRVMAAVYGGAKREWTLQLAFTLRREHGRWLFTSASASTYH